MSEKRNLKDKINKILDSERFNSDRNDELIRDEIALEFAKDLLHEHGMVDPEWIAEHAYQYADAMMTARKAKSNKDNVH